jgi:hypothetical protein
MVRPAFLAIIVEDPFVRVGKNSGLRVVQCAVRELALGAVSTAEWTSGPGRESCPCKGDVVIVQPFGAVQKIIGGYSLKDVDEDAASLIGAVRGAARDAKGRPTAVWKAGNDGNISIQVFAWKDAESENEEDERILVSEIAIGAAGTVAATIFDEREPKTLMELDKTHIFFAHDEVSIELKDNKFSLKNEGKNLFQILKDVLDAIKGMKLVGGPMQHTVSPDDQIKFQNLQNALEDIGE